MSGARDEELADAIVRLLDDLQRSVDHVRNNPIRKLNKGEEVTLRRATEDLRAYGEPLVKMILKHAPGALDMVAPVLSAAREIGWFAGLQEIARRRAAAARAEPEKPGDGVSVMPEDAVPVMPEDDARTPIEAAYRSALDKANNEWELRPRSEVPLGGEVTLREAVNNVMIFAEQIANPRQPPPPIEQFRKVGRTRARLELDKLAEAAETVIRRVDTLHEPAILALADLGIMRGHVISLARSIALSARAADVSGVSAVAGRGKPKNNRAIGLACTVIFDFERLMGQRADLPVDVAGGARGLELLVADIFEAVGIKASAKAAVRAALAARARE